MRVVLSVTTSNFPRLLSRLLFACKMRFFVYCGKLKCCVEFFLKIENLKFWPTNEILFVYTWGKSFPGYVERYSTYPLFQILSFSSFWLFISSEPNKHGWEAVTASFFCESKFLVSYSFGEQTKCDLNFSSV